MNINVIRPSNQTDKIDETLSSTNSNNGFQLDIGGMSKETKNVKEKCYRFRII